MKTRAVAKSLAPALFVLLMLGVFTGCDSASTGTDASTDASTIETLATTQVQSMNVGSAQLKDPSRIPISFVNGTSRTVVRYADLTSDQQRMIDASLNMLRTPSQYPQLSKTDLIFTETGTAGLGCGVNGTKSEPVQVGCWVGEDLCYLSLGENGLDFGCHKCEGGCPPKKGKD